ncbi:hypothetical protein TTHERM_00300460 (macronuclear) [Tetrahymena thermophila SB210]|uniref:Uncharacterized protein n=1 Tax=Tetrahymena thermophila (strain SB210) TaxID=312017 RepID=I7MIE9_TETTS|nr:hypothetical protein TTHERM_00300460 [Tetrahymena thermophila SB210]EAS04328.2 hypothetical protein TTHERM_00300460 [Tetrahymena thermophila SB210]|eukprot:XP_001024573.2 hypothetical protein TTHERM_00300460 [Tetrahymena thermophila SB210]
MADEQEIDVDVSMDSEEQNSSYTVSNAANKKNMQDEQSFDLKNSETGVGKVRNTAKQNIQNPTNQDNISKREMKKILQQISLSESQPFKQSTKGRKKVKKQEEKKTPQSDSSIEHEQNHKPTLKETSNQQPSTSTNSSSAKLNGQVQISVFQQQSQQQLQQQQLQQQQQQLAQVQQQYQTNGSIGGLERIVNAIQIDQQNNLNVVLSNQSENYTMNLPLSTQQNGALLNQQQQQLYYQQYAQKANMVQYSSQQQNNIIVTNDDSDSCSYDNQDDRSNAISNSNMSNINSQQGMNGISQNNMNGPNSNTTNNPLLMGNQAGKRKKTQKKQKEYSMQNLPNPQESGLISNIQVISSEGKMSKQNSSRSNQVSSQNQNIQSNQTPIVASFTPRKQSSQTNQILPQSSLDMSNFQKPAQQELNGNNGKTILITNNSNIIQLQRKNPEEVSLVNQNVQQQQNLEETTNRSIEQQQFQTQNNISAQQAAAAAAQALGIQSIHIKNPAFQIQGLNLQSNQAANNFQNIAHQVPPQQPQHHYHPTVNPSALPQVLNSVHNMINIPSQQIQQIQEPIQNISNINNNNNNNNNNNTNNINNANSINGNTTLNLLTHSTSVQVNSSTYAEQPTINSQTNLQNDPSKTKKKKRSKLNGKAETHIQQQQQAIGQSQQQQQATNQTLQPPQKVPNNMTTLYSKIQDEVITSNQNSNMIGQLQAQTNVGENQQHGLISPVSNSNTFNQNMINNYNSNNGSAVVAKPDNNADQENENEFTLQDMQKLAQQPPILGIQPSQQLIREQSNQKQQIQAKKASRKNEQEYKQKMKKGPLNQSAFEDQTALFLRLSNYQDKQKKEREEEIEKHLEELNESTHSQNGQTAIQQFNTSSLFQQPAQSNSFLGNVFSLQNSTSIKPMLQFKIGSAFKQENEKLEINSQDNDSQTNGNSKTPVVGSNSNQNSLKSRIKKLDNSQILDKTLIIQDKITKKFKNQHFPESFKEAFSSLHSDFSTTYLDPNYFTRVVTFFNRQQEFSKVGEKDETEIIDY